MSDLQPPEFEAGSWRGNVTVDPLAPASPVLEPEIGEILDLRSGVIEKAASFIARHRYDDLVALRVKVREDLNRAPHYACAICQTPCYIVSTQEKRFFFRHRIEDGSCPARTRGVLSEAEIRARKYHGLRESDAHKAMKALVSRSLCADATFHTVLQERVWQSARDPHARRRPDVQALHDGMRVAFEVQLSTTFLDVVVERRNFYRDEGGLLLWVLGNFDPSYRRLTTDDLLFSNNSNVFVVDEETTALSEAERRFHLRCHYRQPVRDGLSASDVWQERVVPFSELQRDKLNQRAFWFDFEKADRELRAHLDEEKRLRRQRIDADLRRRFLSFWLEAGSSFDGHVGREEELLALRMEFLERGIEVPERLVTSASWRALLNALLSAQAGRPVGWGFKRLIEVAHHLAQDYPGHLLVFGFALKHFGHSEAMKSQDASGKWSRKAEVLREKVRQRVPDTLPDPVLMPAIRFLFPEVGAQIDAFLEESA